MWSCNQKGNSFMLPAQVAVTKKFLSLMGNHLLAIPWNAGISGPCIAPWNALTKISKTGSVFAAMGTRSPAIADMRMPTPTKCLPPSRSDKRPPINTVKKLPMEKPPKMRPCIWESQSKSPVPSWNQTQTKALTSPSIMLNHWSYLIVNNVWIILTLGSRGGQIFTCVRNSWNQYFFCNQQHARKTTFFSYFVTGPKHKILVLTHFDLPLPQWLLRCRSSWSMPLRSPENSQLQMCNRGSKNLPR